MIKLICVLVAVLCAAPAWSTTWYVRTDGGAYGTSSTTCNGQTDAAYSAGNGPNCAVNHPFEILGIWHDVEGGYQIARAQQVQANDTVIIKNGSYKMGYDAATYYYYACDPNWPEKCHNYALPNGLKIYGENYNTGCATKPELWGTGGTYAVLNVGSASNVDLRCLDITDHEDCGNSGANVCNYTAPGSATVTFGRNGIYGWGGSGNSFTNMKVHGLAQAGFVLGKQASVTMSGVTILGNHHAGIDQDDSLHSTDNAWSGSHSFTNVSVEWSGCNENYPADGAYNNCTHQDDGGYGDAFGTPNETHTSNYTFTNTTWKYNVSDAIDLIHLGVGSTITVEKSWFEGTNGNSLKLGGGTAVVRNNVFISNCNYISGLAIKSASWPAEYCRGEATIVTGDRTPIANWAIVNNTFISHQDQIISLGYCDGSSSINIKNNLMYGNYKYNNVSNDKASWYYGYSTCSNPAAGAADYNNIYNVKQADPCTATGTGAYTQTNCINTDPQLSGVSWNTNVFNPYLTASSSGIAYGLSVGTTVGNTTVPAVDYNSFARGAAVDLGALEYGSSPSSNTGYTRGAYASLPTGTGDLSTTYSSSDVSGVASADNTRVAAAGIGSQYVIHQFKTRVGTATSATVRWEGQSTTAASSSTVYLQVYNYNSTSWETVASNNSAAANTDFQMTYTFTNLTNYASDGYIYCRVYQKGL